MRKLLLGLVVAVSLASPLAARADIIVEGSLGKGLLVKPDVKAAPINVMVAPGLTMLSMFRFQLGLVADLPDVKASKFDLALRPMLTFAPPLFPIYGRAIFAVNNLLHDHTIAYGGALGFSIELFGLGLFAEAGVLPTSIADTMNWLIEGRAGALIKF